MPCPVGSAHRAGPRANRWAAGPGSSTPGPTSGAHRTRSAAERAIDPLKQDRAVATRYDERAAIHDGTVRLAPIRIRLRGLARSKNTP
ncbi:hypothetical protein GCM10009605_58470 [Nocardiopsis composta]